MQDSNSFRILSESQNYILGHQFEDVFLVNKSNNSKISIGDHYGDLVAGIIGPDESWFVTAGEGVLYFDFKRGIRSFFRQPGIRSPYAHNGTTTAFVHAIRLESPTKVRVLLDPWSECASVWVLDTRSLKIEKIEDGPSLAGQPWQEDVPF